MFGKKEVQPQKRIDGLIPTGTVIRGDIIFGGGLRIDVDDGAQSAKRSRGQFCL